MNKDKFTKIMYFIIILILILFNLIIFRKQVFKDKIKETNANNKQKEIVKKDISNNELKEQEYNKLVNDSQEKRTKKYLADFVDNISSNNKTKINKAYSHLNNNFKEKYFKTESDFEQFVNARMKMKGPAINYLDEKSYGDLFVEKVEIYSTDDVNAKKIKTAFVIKETGYEEYTVSFDIDMVNKSNKEESR